METHLASTAETSAAPGHWDCEQSNVQHMFYSDTDNEIKGNV